MAMTEMLCQAFSSRSSSRRTYTEPLPEWMLNTLSMSVRQSMVYLQENGRVGGVKRTSKRTPIPRFF